MHNNNTPYISSFSDDVVLVAENVYTYYLLDHQFHYTWLIFKGVEFDLRGALDANQLSVAYISGNDMLLWGVKLYLYEHHLIPNTLDEIVYAQALSIMDVNHQKVVNTLIHSYAETDDDILQAISAIKSVCCDYLISSDLWDLMGRGKEFHFTNHVGSVNKIDKLFKDIDSKRIQRLVYPDEVTQLIRDIGQQVTKGK